MTHNVFIGIEYGEAYEAVVISGPGKFEQKFATGDPVKDFADAAAFGAARAKEKACAFMTLSSLDGFVFDVMGYRYNRDDMLEIDPTDYHPDGRLKTRAEVDQELGLEPEDEFGDEVGRALRREREEARTFAIVFNHHLPTAQVEPTVYTSYTWAREAARLAGRDYPTMDFQPFPNGSGRWMVEALDAETDKSVGFLHDSMPPT